MIVFLYEIIKYIIIVITNRYLLVCLLKRMPHNILQDQTKIKSLQFYI